MIEIPFQGWLVESDDETNRKFDRESVGFGLESCNCDHCCNFFAVKGEIYSAEVLDFIERLGVRRPFEAEVVHYGPENEGILYHAWIPFFGVIKTKPESTGELGLFKAFPLHVPGMEGRPVIQLVWPLVLPWVLEDRDYPG